MVPFDRGHRGTRRKVGEELVINNYHYNVNEVYFSKKLNEELT